MIITDLYDPYYWIYQGKLRPIPFYINLAALFSLPNRNMYIHGE